MIFFNFFIGTILGSHALVIVQRNFDKSFVYSFSKCDACNFPLTLFDQIPIFSFILKRGRCSYCKEKIPFMTLFIELFSGIIFSHIFLFSLDGFNDGLFLFFFLICSIFDYYFLEFETILLIFPAVLGLCAPNSAIHSFSFLGWFLLVTLTLLMLLMNLSGKLGTGDTLFFVLISLYKGQLFGLHVLFLASLLFLFLYPFNTKKSAIAFLPFLLISYCFFAFL